MDQEIITQLAQAIQENTFVPNIGFYSLVFAIAFLASTGASFVLPYLSKRGKNYATKKDFEDILDQLSQATNLSEQIKAEINTGYQEQVGINTLLREKLENLLDETYELDRWVDRTSDLCAKGEVFRSTGSPMAKIEMYQALYFPKLEKDLLKLKVKYRELTSKYLEQGKAIREGRDFGYDDYRDQFRAYIGALGVFRDDIVKNGASEIGLHK